jgi:hypothetical protein
VEHDRPGGAGRAGAGQPRSGRTGVGRGTTGATLAWPGGGRLGPGRQCKEDLAVATTHVEAMRERERSGRKKWWGRVLYPLIFVEPTHQPTNISRLVYMVVVVPYVRRPPDEHKLHTSV